jgi:hypothetical protein
MTRSDLKRLSLHQLLTLRTRVDTVLASKLRSERRTECKPKMEKPLFHKRGNSKAQAAAPRAT